jgi:hypothetical protein
MSTVSIPLPTAQTSSETPASSLSVSEPSSSSTSLENITSISPTTFSLQLPSLHTSGSINKPTTVQIVDSGSVPQSLPSSTTSSAPTVTSPSVKPSTAKVPAKKRVVRTNGGDLWRKAIEKSMAPPIPYPKLQIPFNLSTPEILAGICNYITGDDIIRLYETGDQALQHRLFISIEDWSFRRQIPHSCYESRKSDWSALIGQLGKVRHFSYTHQKSKDLKLSLEKAFPLAKLSSFPTTLRTLKLQCRISNDDICLLKNFINLDVLSLGPPIGIRNSPLFFFQDLPPNLTWLHTTYALKLSSIINAADSVTDKMRESVPVFQYLRHLDLPQDQNLGAQFIRLLHPDVETLHLPRNSELPPEALLELPTGLKTLSLNFERLNASEIFSALPSGLETLKFYGIKVVGMNNECFQRLPKSITNLRLPKSSLDLQLFAGSWPLPNLLHLDIRGPDTGLLFGDLPRNLKSLRLEGNFNEDILTMPPHLTKLVMPNVRATNALIPHLSRELHTLKLHEATSLTGSCLWYLPRNLTNLVLAGQYNDGVLCNLPTTLKRLSMPNATLFSNYSFKNFPRSLTRLELTAVIQFTEICVPLLPPHLEVFAINGSKRNSLPGLKLSHKIRERSIKEAKLASLDSIDGNFKRS